MSRVHWAVGDDLAFFHVFTFKHVEVTPFVDQLLVRARHRLWGDNQTFLPLVSLPKPTTPEISAKMAGSLGLRASNRSATRGRPR